MPDFYTNQSDAQPPKGKKIYHLKQLIILQQNQKQPV